MTWSREALVGYLFGMHAEKAEVGGRVVAVSNPSSRLLGESAFPACLFRNSDCNTEALAGQQPERAAQYARLKLAGLDDAPCHLAVFADRDTAARGHGLGRQTMPEMSEYSAVAAVHTLWLAARAEGIGMGWVSILDPRTIADVLEVPPDWKLIGYFCLGFPKAEDDVPALQRSQREERRPAASFLLSR
jgi:5,6-dimethylbenzimidazole synthase